MPPATFDETTVDVEAATYLFRVKGSVPKFAGWMAVYNQEPAEERTRGARPGRGERRGRRRRERAAAAQRRRSARAARRSSRSRSSRSRRRATAKRRSSRRSKRTASAGRARTRRSSASSRTREYVNKIEGRFKPTLLGMMLVEKLLSPAFDDILDVNYTRELEEELDEIEEGKNDYESTLSELLQEVRERPEARRQGDDQPQGGRRDRPKMAATSAARRW